MSAWCPGALVPTRLPCCLHGVQPSANLQSHPAGWGSHSCNGGVSAAQLQAGIDDEEAANNIRRMAEGVGKDAVDAAKRAEQWENDLPTHKARLVSFYTTWVEGDARSSDQDRHVCLVSHPPARSHAFMDSGCCSC